MRLNAAERAALYDQRGAAYCSPLDLTLPFIDEMLPRSVSSVLDIGCGRGDILAYAAKSLKLAGDDATGVDISSVRIAYARQQHPALRFVAADAFEFLSAPGLRYGAVLLFEVLEHVDDDLKLLALARAACAGRILGSLPVRVKEMTHARDFASHEEAARRYRLTSWRARGQHVLFSMEGGTA